MKRISFYTFGCRLNQSETAVIQNSFEHQQYKVVDFAETSDIVVVNTCTVTENGDADTRRLVNKISRNNPKAKIALVGCQAQTQRERLADMPNVAWIVGNGRKFDLTSIIEEFEATETAHVITPPIEKESFTIDTPGIDRDHTRANLKIQDGCDFFCSFCEIPYARGRARSREFQDILKEAKILADAGHREIVITGINVGTYSHEGKNFLDVIKALEQIPKIERIRISSIEPTTIPIELFKMMSKQSKLCRYLHIPLQSGSNEVLKNMQRKYSYEEFLYFVQMAKKTVEEICIGTDVIVGFPGETEKLFKETEERLREETPLDYFHVFSYSERNWNKSRRFEEKISPETINDRGKILRELSQRKRHLYNDQLIGTQQKVLFEQKKNDRWTGLTDHYVRVFVDSDQNLHNRIANVQLLKNKGKYVEAKIF